MPGINTETGDHNRDDELRRALLDLRNARARSRQLCDQNLQLQEDIRALLAAASQSSTSDVLTTHLLEKNRALEMRLQELRQENDCLKRDNVRLNEALGSRQLSSEELSSEPNHEQALQREITLLKYKVTRLEWDLGTKQTQQVAQQQESRASEMKLRLEIQQLQLQVGALGQEVENWKQECERITAIAADEQGSLISTIRSYEEQQQQRIGFFRADRPVAPLPVGVLPGEVSP